MKYAFYEAKLVCEDPASKNLYYGNGQIFYFLDKENDNSKTLYMFALTNEKFRTAQISKYNFFESSTNMIEKMLPSTYYGFRTSPNSPWKITEKFSTDDEEEMKKWANENDIVLFKHYQSDMREIKVELENNTRLSNNQIMDIVSNINIQRIIGTKDSTYIGNHSHPIRIVIVFDKDKEYSYDPNCAIYDEGFSDWVKEYVHLDKSYYNNVFSIPKTSVGYSFVYVQTTENSISMDKIMLSVALKKDSLQIITEKKYSYDYTIGKPIVCTKYMKTKNKDVSALEMFHINSQTISNPPDIFVFDGAINVYDFFVKNEKFLTKCGLSKLLQEYSHKVNVTSFIILYFCLIQEYSIIELLVKMGHTNLIEDIFKKLYSCGRKEEIVENVNNLSGLINSETTKGSLALRIPSYIAEFLKNQRSPLKTYLFWRDIYEIEDISKENFEKFQNMPEKIIISSEISDAKEKYWWNATNWSDLQIQEIIKYEGYSLNKVFKYVYQITMNKETDGYHRNHSVFVDTFNTLRDTLCMAEELNFELEPYPENLQQIHNQLSKIMEEKKTAIENKAVTTIGEQCEKAIEAALASNSVTLPKTAIENYCYVIPHTQQDFTQEGQQQHNCVAGYFSRVKRGECIIFFIREKNNPEKSFVTAEIRNKKLGQVMYSNNRPVPTDSLVYQYCKFICKTILSGVDKGEIFALNKILNN